MDSFVEGLLANLIADGIIGTILFYVITRPDEKRKSKELIKISLANLKAEVEINHSRSRLYCSQLEDEEDELIPTSPFRFSRGAWNALKETEFFAQNDDVNLANRLFRMNEATFVANRNLRRYQMAYLEDTGGNKAVIADLAKDECISVEMSTSRVLESLAFLDLPSSDSYDPFAPETHDDPDEDAMEAE